MTSPLVVKLGGSLMDMAPEVLNQLAKAKTPMLIVPGGGIFADAVRNSGSDDEHAHWMAICGMEQFGWYLSGFGVSVTNEILMPNEGQAVFLPYQAMRRYDPLPHSWEVTSDSIAAWVAGELSADLLLLKSVDGTKSDVLDNFCRRIIRENKTHAVIINVCESGRLSSYLHGEDGIYTKVI